jgi:hypothetical protein
MFEEQTTVRDMLGWTEAGKCQMIPFQEIDPVLRFLTGNFHGRGTSF